MFDPIKAMLPDSVADVAAAKREARRAVEPDRAKAQKAQAAGQRIAQRLDGLSPVGGLATLDATRLHRL